MCLFFLSLATVWLHTGPQLARARDAANKFTSRARINSKSLNSCIESFHFSLFWFFFFGCRGWQKENLYTHICAMDQNAIINRLAAFPRPYGCRKLCGARLTPQPEVPFRKYPTQLIISNTPTPWMYIIYIQPMRANTLAKCLQEHAPNGTIHFHREYMGFVQLRADEGSKLCLPENQQRYIASNVAVCLNIYAFYTLRDAVVSYLNMMCVCSLCGLYAFTI